MPRERFVPSLRFLLHSAVTDVLFWAQSASLTQRHDFVVARHGAQVVIVADRARPSARRRRFDTRAAPIGRTEIFRGD